MNARTSQTSHDAGRDLGNVMPWGLTVMAQVRIRKLIADL